MLDRMASTVTQFYLIQFNGYINISILSRSRDGKRRKSGRFDGAGNLICKLIKVDPLMKCRIISGYENSEGNFEINGIKKINGIVVSCSRGEEILLIKFAWGHSS